MFVSCLNYKTVWLLPFAESPAAFRGEQHSDLHSSSLTMEAAQHGVRDVERVHDGAPHKATPRPRRGWAGASPGPCP